MLVFFPTENSATLWGRKPVTRTRARYFELVNGAVIEVPPSRVRLGRNERMSVRVMGDLEAGSEDARALTEVH